ncbi:MAG: GntR family transcriptional regulator [Halanaerobiales bacterium]
MLEKMKKVNKESPLPLYYQLKESIIEVIRKEGIKSGTRIPSERKLCDYHEVSRMTVHKAVERLVQDGHLYREHGRGTFVASRNELNFISPLASFSREIKERGLNSQTELIDREIIEGDKKVCEKLNLRPGSKLYRLKRLRRVEGVPFLWETVYLSKTKIPELKPKKLQNNSLYRLLEEEYNLRLNYAEATVEPVLLKEKVASKLELSENELGLFFQQLTFLESQQPVEWTEAYYRSDNYKFKLKFGKKL